ncbi:MAG: pyruvate kinase [Firmicutes bacterium]|nr:pyruvate kinase [Bacillota bacterium]
MTKIVATLGPASNKTEIIALLAKAGMNVVRINFSHGDYKTHGEIIKAVKTVREKLKIPLPILLDTKGPEIRIGRFALDKKVYLAQGNKFTLTTNNIDGDEKHVSVTYKDLPKDLKKGGRVLIDDGLIELKVLDLTETDIICEVINSGFLGSCKGINIPDVYVNLPSLTEKDEKDILFGIENGIDFIAASFIRTAEDVVKIKEILKNNHGEYIKVIAKIECRDGVNNIDSILEVSDGIMVARGDLGVEIPPEEVPLVQKLLIKKANEKGKEVITATQMLESMVNNLRPTRAEANDVANSILDGSSAIMLSGETAQGKYPVESVKMMARIAYKTESSLDYHKELFSSYKNFRSNITNSISFATCTIAKDLKVACIATVTNSGFTARMLSKFRPVCPILAITPNEHVWRQLSLTWGCLPILSDKININDGTFSIAVEKSMETGLAKSGDAIVIAAGIPVGVSGATNTLKVQIVGDVLAKGQGIGNKVVSGRACVIKVFEQARNCFKDGDIIVTPEINDELLPFIKKSSGVVVGSWENDDNKQAKVIADLLDIPVIVCNESVVEIIPDWISITLDSIKGIVYNGNKS